MTLAEGWACAAVVSGGRFDGEAGRYYRFVHGLKRSPEWVHAPGATAALQDWTEQEVLVLVLKTGPVEIRVGLGRRPA